MFKKLKSLGRATLTVHNPVKILDGRGCGWVPNVLSRSRIYQRLSEHCGLADSREVTRARDRVSTANASLV